MRKAILPLLGLLLSPVMACIRPPTNEVAEPTAPEPTAEPSATWIIEVPYDNSGDQPSDSEPVAVAPSPAPSRHLPDPVFFRVGAGYGALGLIDLAPCRDQGLAGYLHMRITFRESGQVARAAVESRVAPSIEALTCIREQLKVAKVPVFEGGDVTLSRSFFVNSAGLADPVSL